MIIDSSAIVAILAHEPEREQFLGRIGADTNPAMSAASYVEVGIVVDRRRDPNMSRAVNELLSALSIELRPFTAAQATIARAAYRDFGRGSGHAANLNFGDCLSYALAKDLDQPLLFKGNDFIHTDVRRAI